MRKPVPILAAVASGTLALALYADQINLVKLNVDSFTVVGIQTRTSNAREKTSDALIPGMWARLMNENLLSRIPKRLDSRIVALYTDYESDKDGLYTYVLGAKVSSAKDLPPGMTWRIVPSGTYAMFTAQGGPPPQMVVSLWQRIWSLEKPGSLHRAYKTDFEVHYGPADPAKAQVDVYVGLEK